MHKFKTLSFVIAGAFVLHSGPALSADYIQGCGVDLSDKNTHIYYINGAGDSYFSAEASLAALMANTTDDNILFRMSYYAAPVEFERLNTAVADALTEAGLQSSVISEDVVINWFNNSVPLSAAHDYIRASIHTVDADALIEQLNEDVWGALQTAYVEGFLEATKNASQPTYSDLNYYEADLLAGKRVILVSHSHGTAIAKNAMTQLAERQAPLMDSVGAIYIAPTVELYSGETTYFLADDDVLVNGLRNTGVPVSQANITQTGDAVSSRGVLNHEFLTSYYNPGLATFDLINTEINTLNETLIVPPKRAGSGAIRASLTWDNYGDLDIYIEEPNGEMLYYGNTEGELKSGSIDVDNRYGFGPENYYVPCHQLVEGRYVFGANYYSARSAYERDLAITAKLTLSFGNGQMPKPVELVLPYATSSSDTQEMMIEVNVTVDDNGNLYYDYLPLIEPE